MPGDFTISLPVEFTVQKAGDGECVPQHKVRFKGIASTGSVDRQNERFSDAALKSFAQQGVGLDLCIGGNHADAMVDVTSEIGKVDTCSVEDGAFGVEGYLWDAHPWAAYMAQRLNDPEVPPAWQMSIGGKVPEGGKATEWGSWGTDPVGVINDVKLNHVLLCRGGSAVNPETSFGAAEKVTVDWADVIFKAAAEIDDVPVAPEGEVDTADPDVSYDGVPAEEQGDDLAKAGVSETPWEQVDKANLPPSCFLYVGDPKLRKTWKFPVFEGVGSQRGALNRNAMVRARGRLAATEDANVRAVVEPRLNALYDSFKQEDTPSGTEGNVVKGEHMPDVPENVTTEETAMSLWQRLGQLLSGGAGVAAKADGDENPCGCSDAAPAEDAPAEDAPAAEEAPAAEVPVEKVDDVVPEYATKDDVTAAVAAAMAPIVAMLDGMVAAKAEADSDAEKVEAPVEEVTAEPVVDETAAKVAELTEIVSKLLPIAEAIAKAEGKSMQPEATTNRVDNSGDTESIFGGFLGVR
jgi:hypothetical protein